LSALIGKGKLMMDNRLILVEGLPGTGKSTMAQYIWLESKKNNIDIEYICERQKNHPVETEYNSFDVNVKKYIDDSLKSWSTLVDRIVTEDKKLILDGSFIQHQINCLIFADETVEIINAYIMRLCETIKKLNPILIYLNYTDTDEAILNACTVKGERWSNNVANFLSKIAFSKNRGLTDKEAMFTFFKYRHDIEIKLLSMFDIEKLIIDVQNKSYDERRIKVCEKLKLQFHKEMSEKNRADISLAGKYTNKDINVTLNITCTDGFLIGDGIKLLWKEKDTYYSEGTTSELIFHRNEEGYGVSIEVSGKELGFFFPLGTIFENYERVLST
jgi:tRNA uridine 5-carbamoylmethylation protein Kti12